MTAFVATMCPRCGDNQLTAEMNSDNEFVPHLNRRTGEPCPGVPLVVYCVHCGRKCGDFDGGWAGVGEAKLCHPKAEGRPDCYHMVDVYHHELRDCARCSQDPYQPLTSAEYHDAMIDSLRQLEQVIRDAMP